MTVGNNGAGIHNVIPDVGDESVGVCDIMMNGGDGCICVFCKLLLEAES